jgi:hypothetical protein
VRRRLAFIPAQSPAHAQHSAAVPDVAAGARRG